VLFEPLSSALLAKVRRTVHQLVDLKSKTHTVSNHIFPVSLVLSFTAFFASATTSDTPKRIMFLANTSPETKPLGTPVPFLKNVKSGTSE
jgi:hypothetical protein